MAWWITPCRVIATVTLGVRLAKARMLLLLVSNQPATRLFMLANIWTRWLLHSSLKGIAPGKKYFNKVLRFSIQAALQIFFENSQFVKQLQTVEVCSFIQRVHAICAPNCIDPPRAASNSTPSPLNFEVPRVVNGGENFSPKILVTSYRCGRFW